MNMRHIIITMLLYCGVLFSKAPEITPHEAKVKLEQIFKAHVSHKRFTPDLMQRTLQNFLLELDPTKTYFTEDEIDKWDIASPDILEKTIQSFNNQDFSQFEVIHEKMVTAIERRNELEREVENEPLPKDVSANEFKDLIWAKTRLELKHRLLKIKALQLDAAKNLEQETQDQFYARLKKRRLHREAEILSTSPQSRKRQTLVYFLKAASSALDNHTAYFTPTEARQFMIEIDQRLFGIGAQLRDDLNGLTVIRLLDGGPAKLSKTLKIGDRIIAVDQEPIVGWEISEAVELIRGKEGSIVSLTVLREHADTEKKEKIDVQIVRREIVLKETRYDTHIEPFGDGVIARINLYSFYQDPKSSAASDIKSVILDLKKEHSDKLLGIILDLRNNPGGHLSQAIGVAGLFINKGVVVSIKDNNGAVQHLRNIESNKVWDGPLLTLTNRASASAAEIVAQSLQDYGRALIIGDDKTFGKGTYQTFTLDPSNHKINPKGEFKVTRGMYFTVSGKSPQLHGAKADIEVPGALTAIDVGENFSKFPLEADHIAAKFNDDLSDISPFQRRKIKAFYEKDLQPKLTTYEPYLDILKSNSATRIENNPNYQNFLKAIKKDEPTSEEIEAFGLSDLQLEEASNVMKDLIMLMRLKVHQTASISHPAQAGA